MAGDTRGLERLASVGASFRTLGFERLGDLVLPQDERAIELPALARALGADELVYLATCNRVECWLTLPEGARADALPGQLAAFMSARGGQVAPAGLVALSGRDSLEHLLRVASALESLVVGETEIAGQVRRAADEASARGLLGDGLRPVFDRASACARRVRAALDGARPPASAADLAVEKIRQHLCAQGPRVCALVGVGPMTRKVATALSESPCCESSELIFVNRTLTRAEELAARFGGRAVTLEAFQRDPPPWLDLVFTATSAREHVVRPEHLAPALAARHAAGLERPLIVCDLGVPRDVDPACESLPGALVVALEHMEALAHVRATVDGGLERASSVVGEEVERFVREAKFRAIASESARAMLESRLAHLPAADREAILRFAGGLGERLARQPSSSS
jgi:glutamyl-tRNA reductase